MDLCLTAESSKESRRSPLIRRALTGLAQGNHSQRSVVGGVNGPAPFSGKGSWADVRASGVGWVSGFPAVLNSIAMRDFQQESEGGGCTPSKAVRRSFRVQVRGGAGTPPVSLGGA